jgi:Arc/MetJ-type ribon-helix-helix transcriptional regulator
VGIEGEYRPRQEGAKFSILYYVLYYSRISIMDSPVTLRLDKETRHRIARIAGDKRVSASEVIREAIQAWVEEHEATTAPYDSIADLIGVVHGKNPKRSTGTGRQFKKILKDRRGRS